MSIKSIAFKAVLIELLKQAQRKKKPYLDITSGSLHRLIGGYPGKEQALPSCCNVMKKLMSSGDIVISQPPKGQGANLKIRYYLPRYDSNN